MGPTLWPHQVEALEVCTRAHAAKRSRVLVQIPPGTGKTEIAAQVALSWVQSRPFGRALVCVSSGPVLEQFARRLRALTRLPIAIELARLPDEIRGYGHIKAAAMQRAAEKREALLARWRTGGHRPANVA